MYYPPKNRGDVGERSGETVSSISEDAAYTPTPEIKKVPLYGVGLSNESITSAELKLYKKHY